MCSARLAVDLVHRPARRYEGGETAWAQPLDRAGDKVIMQGQAQFSSRIVGAHRPVRERWIPDCEVVELRQSRLREILMANAGVRVEEFGDPGGRWVHFDAGQREFAGEGFRARAKNRPVPQPGSRTRPPSKPIRRSVRQMARIMNSGV